MSKLGHFSPIPVFLASPCEAYRLISLLWVGNGKCSVVIPSHSHQAMLFPIPVELE